MSKKDRKQQMAKELKGACLHCAFFQLHQQKWPDWQADGDNVSPEAFSDLVRSAIKVAAEVSVMMDKADQMKFMMDIRMSTKQIEDGGDSRPESVAEVVELFKAAFSTKH